MLLHAARRYFHDDNGLPNLEALKNIYQVVAQQLLNSRERDMKKITLTEQVADEYEKLGKEGRFSKKCIP